MHVNRRRVIGFCPDLRSCHHRLLHRTASPRGAIAVLMARRAAALVVLTLSATQSACAAVRPWEREALAKRVMQLDRDRTEVRVRESLLSYREGSTGALGTKGGGCGCD